MMKRVKSCKVLNVNFDAYSGTGGIQRYCRMLDSILEDVRIPCVSISLWDRQADKPKDSPLRTHYGCGRRKIRFMVVFLKSLWGERLGIVWFHHVMFLPLIPLVRVFTRAEVWVSVYGDEVWERANSLGLRYLNKADRVIAISNHTVDKLRQLHGVDPVRIALCHLGVDRGFNVECDDPGRRSEVGGQVSPYVLVVSRLNLPDAENKGVLRVCEAMGRIVDTYPTVRCLVVGDGKDRKALEEVIQVKPWGGNVRWLGRVSDDELDRLYAGATVFALPSTVEGFGLVFVEAMIHGCPVVAGNEDASSDVVVDGETGFLVNALDVDAIALAFRRLLADPGRRAAMGAAGRQRALQYFTYEAMRDRVRTLFRDAGIGG